jgi:hypothetical protein
VTTLTMYDSIDVTQIPASAAAVAGYVGGSWPTFASLQKLFPHACLLSVAISADEDADVLDVEPLDAKAPQAPGWVRRQQARGVYRPGLYAQASSMEALLATVAAAGIARASVRLWSAHYGAGAHICGPQSCGYPGVPACDGTQWTPAALGRNLDQSLLLAGFFDGPPPAPAPATLPEDAMIMVQPPETGLPAGVKWPGVFLLDNAGALHHVTATEGSVSNVAAYQEAGIKGPVTITYAEYLARGGH